MPTILGVGPVLGSLMQEYHHFGAYPTLSHQMDIKVGHLIKRMARSSPATSRRSLAKPGLAVIYVPFWIFNPTWLVCCALDVLCFPKHNLRHHTRVNRTTIALLNASRLLDRSHQNFQIEPCTNHLGHTGRCLST